MLLLKKCMLLSAIGILTFCCTACTAKQPTVSTPVEVTSPSSMPEDETQLSTSDILPTPDATVLAYGKELLKEYDVQYNQVIRFPIEGRVCESRGAHALTTLEEACSMHPDVFIPEKLDDYKFLDLTIYYERTSNVFHDMVPRPKNTIEVLTITENLHQHYLCYKNDSMHIRINILPMYTESEHEDIDLFVDDMTPWSVHPDVYVATDLDGPKNLPYLMILPEQDGNYAFFVQKMITSDCLESDIADFTEEEALSAYEAVRNGFSEE